MNFNELFNLALKRNVISLFESFSIDPSKTILQIIKETYSTSAVYDDPFIKDKSYKLSGTAGSGGNYLGKGELATKLNEGPIMNTLCFFVEWLKTNHRNKYFTDEGSYVRLITTPLGTPAVGTLGSSKDAWEGFVLETNKILNLATPLELFDDLRVSGGNNVLWFETSAKSNRIYPAYWLKFNEKPDITNIVNELDGLHLEDAIAHAIAAHFNDTSDPNPLETYKGLLDVVTGYPEKQTFMFAIKDYLNNKSVINGPKSFFEGRPQFWFKGKFRTPVLIRRLGINLQADDTEYAIVQQLLSSIASSLFWYVIQVYEKLTNVSNATPSVASSTFTPTGSASTVTNKSQAEAQADANSLYQMYIDILEGRFKDIPNPSSGTPVQSPSQVTTVQDMVALETHLSLDTRSATAIRELLARLCMPATPASILGVTAKVGSTVADVASQMRGKI